MVAITVVVLVLVGFFWGVDRLAELRARSAQADEPPPSLVYRCACGAEKFYGNSQCDECRYRAADAPEFCRWCSSIVRGDEFEWHEQQCCEQQRREQRARERVRHEQGEGFPETREYLVREPGLLVVVHGKPPARD